MSFGGGDSVFANAAIFYKGDALDLSASRSRSEFLGNIVLGYQYRSWNFGINLDLSNEKNTYEDDSGETEYSWNRTAYGPLVGYNFGNFFLNLSIFINPTLKTKAPAVADNTYSGGMGYQLVGGYNHPVTQNFYLGLQLAYRGFEYKKNKTSSGSTDLPEKYSSSSLDPFLTLTFYFR